MNRGREISLLIIGLILANTIVIPFTTHMVFAKVQSETAEKTDVITTQLIVGINNAEPSNGPKLRDLIIESDGDVINKVRMNKKDIAFVVELPLKAASSRSSEMKANGWASYVEPRKRAEPLFIPNDANWSDQWALKKIETDWAWNFTKGSSEILVAIIDSGIEWNHTDLTTNYQAGGYDWVNNDPDPMDSWGHGTFIAGEIAAVLNNSEGIAGIAQVKIMAEKIFENRTYGGDYDQIANAIYNATDSGADIISMSFRYYEPSVTVYNAIKYAHDNNVVLVGGAGNDHVNAMAYPAAYDEVIAVSGTTQNDELADFTNFGDWVELAAPATNIVSTFINNTYKNWQGTSFSTPIVSGLAALILSRYPHLRRKDSVRYWLRYTAEDLGEKGFDVGYGYGRVNAHAAINTTTPSYDLAAISLEIPSLVEANASREVDGVILNFGTHDQSNVNVTLLENTTTVESMIISFLPNGSLARINFSWTPDLGVYDLTLRVKPENPAFDEISHNNNLSRSIRTRFPTILSVPSEYASIQAALNETIPKDTIRVSAGTYNESIYIGKSDVRLIGNGSETTTIQGVYSGGPYKHVIAIGAKNVTVSGFRILPAPEDKAMIDSGILIGSYGGANVSLNHILNTTWSVRLVAASGNLIARNNVTGVQASIYLYESFENDIFHNTFYRLSSGVGVKTRFSRDNKIVHNNFENNYTTQQVWAYKSQDVFEDSYPNGGNFWVTYNGTDNFSGPYQNESGSDGIGDTPHIILDSKGEAWDDEDMYPLMEPLNHNTSHEIVILSLTSNETHVTPGEIVKISVTVRNQGNFTESFSVSANAYNATEDISYDLGTQNITALSSSSNQTLAFNWNTTEATCNVSYTLKAEAEIVPHEWDIADNTYIDDTVLVRQNTPPQKPLEPDGYQTVTAGQSNDYNSTTSDPDGDQVWYEFDWDDETTTEIGPYDSNVAGYYASHAWGIAGTYDVKVRARDNFHDYSNWSDPHEVTVNNPPLGCPFVYVWNGTEFVIDNNLLTGSASSNGTEVEDYYRLVQDLVPLYEGDFNSYYSLQIGEFQQEHSYFDQVQLFTVDHQANVSVAVSPTGEILTYQDPYPPNVAVDEANVSWLDELSEIDGEYYEGYYGSYVVLDFGEVNSSVAKLILVADPPPPTKDSIHIQVFDSSKGWVEVTSIIPRTYWSTDIIDLSDYLPTDGELVVRLYFTDNHRVDFVGLDTTPQAEIDVKDANLLWAYHSEEGFVTAELSSDDDVYAELVPDQQITLLFRAPNPDGEARTFIFYVKGYYYTITG